MSLLGFQRAMTAICRSPDVCRAVREDAEAALAEFDLTPRERRRVAAAAAQAGMRVNCSLYRANRIGPIFTLLARTCVLLGNDLRGVMDRFWAEHPVPDFVTRREVPRFGRWLRGEIAAGRVDAPHVSDVVEMEVAFFELGLLPRRRIMADLAVAAAEAEGPPVPHPLLRVVPFSHDPVDLLDRLSRRQAPPYAGLAPGDFHVLVDGRREVRTIGSLRPDLGRALLALQRGAGEVDAERERALLSAGLVVRAGALASVPEVGLRG